MGALRQVVNWIKPWVVDTAANFLYWHPILFVSEITFMGFSLQESLAARTGNFIFALLTGAIYGKAMNLGRYLLNRSYYQETIHGIERKHTWRTQVRDALVDTLTTSIYWNAIMAP